MGLMGSKKEGVTTDTLSQQELNFLLLILSESTFEGKDVLLLGGKHSQQAEQSA